MHPRIKIFLLSLTTVFGLLTASLSTVHAAGILSVDTSGGVAPAFGDSNHGGYTNTWISDGIYNSTSTQVYLAVSGSHELTLAIGTSGAYSSDFALATTTVSGTGWQTFTYPAKFFIVNKTYTFTIWDNNSAGQFYNVYYGVGNATGQRNSFGSWSAVSPVGMTMQVISSEPAAPVLTFLYPIDGQLQNDFTDWNIQYSSPQGAYWNGWVGVSYGNSSTSLDHTDSYQTGTYRPDTHTIYFPKTMGAPNATTSIWYAQAFFADLHGNLVTVTPIISFGISGWGTDYTGTSTINVANTNPYATSSPWYVDCSAYTGISAMSAEGFGCYIIKGAKIVGQFLFQPSTFYENYLSYEITQFQNTFPQVLYYTVKNGIASSTPNGLNGATTSIAIPVWLTSSSTTTPTGYITILSKAQLNSAFGNGNWDWLMDKLSIAMWFAWVIMILITVVDGKIIFTKGD